MKKGSKLLKVLTGLEIICQLFTSHQLSLQSGISEKRRVNMAFY
jgi:hypothetical protein